MKCKFFAVLGLAALGLTAFAAELISTAAPQDWMLIGGSGCKIEKVSADGADALKLTGESGTFATKKSVAVNPAKTYRLSGEFKVPAGIAKSSMYFGFVLYDAKNRCITAKHVNVVPNTDTVLAAPVNRGDKVIRIANGANWKSGGLYAVAFNSNPDYSDLPNYTSSNSVVKVEKKGNVYEVTLSSPVNYILKSGSGVRQHRYAGTYLYVVPNKSVDGNWRKFSGTIKGMAKSSISNTKWWPNTANARIMIIGNNQVKNGVMLVRNITVEEVK